MRLRLASAGDQRDREIEILVLRQQVQVLQRKVGCPKLRLSASRHKVGGVKSASVLPSRCSHGQLLRKKRRVAADERMVYGDSDMPRNFGRLAGRSHAG